MKATSASSAPTAAIAPWWRMRRRQLLIHSTRLHAQGQWQQSNSAGFWTLSFVSDICAYSASRPSSLSCPLLHRLPLSIFDVVPYMFHGESVLVMVCFSIEGRQAVLPQGHLVQPC
jgi:hypothetical protein